MNLSPMKEKGSHNRAVALVGPASAVRRSVCRWQSITFVRSRRKNQLLTDSAALIRTSKLNLSVHYFGAAHKSQQISM
ncbi:hypothetical protein [Paraburkholderia sp. RL17-337-BIB-A]|uniref:hypothetical protein n=1 Tax=Paraburkholderia sp. RL17-337-BIB-A TaxID=3031636 RepID=UPI0038B9B9C0